MSALIATSHMCKTGSELKVLLVDDDHNDLALFGIAVERSDLDIWLQTAPDAEKAMAYLEGRGEYADRTLFPVPDILLLDLSMPRLNGLDFLQWRQTSAEAAAIPVVLLTGMEQKTLIDKARALGACGCIVKPLQFGEWIESVRQLWELARKDTRETVCPGGE